MFQSQKKSIAISLALALSASGITACSMKKNMDQMGQDTHKMAATTEKMAEVTDEMSAKTGVMPDKMDESLAHMIQTYAAIEDGRKLGKAAGSRTIRDDQVKAIETANNIKTKFDNSVVFAESLEFNLWNPAMETLESRQVQFEEGVKELFKRVAKYKHNEKVGPAGMSDDAETLYSIAAAMHYRNKYQDEVWALSKNFDQKSILTLLVDGLVAKKENLSMDDLNRVENHYKREVIRNEKLAVHLLRVRANFLAGYAFAILADDPGTIKKLVYIVQTGMGINWTPKWSVQDTAAEVDYVAQILEHSNATRKILAKLGYNPERSSLMDKVFKNMNRLDPTAEKDHDRASAQTRLNEAVDRFLDSDVSKIPSVSIDQGGPLPRDIESAETPQSAKSKKELKEEKKKKK